MACLNLLKKEQQQGLYNPRISFSNDFADPQPVMKQENSYREAPISSDFEFSISNYPMENVSPRLAKGTSLWKELKRSHIVPKKAVKSGVMERTDDLFHKQIYANLKGSNWRR
ncbi:Hypothetical predicted protein [Olea europaea subsp. europaea]|uniref:Uncharacterized protein n=1 Tax=Olea europaea subsp. europaea TaxID=158383 RepID=A0A8S0PUA0_OLEEU|nr:Hypothetical predicted protein [Olea europaea subsp. europaea]